jgi:putative endonuclease
MLPRHLEVGMQAELRAAEYLGALGYEVLERNFRAKCGELDLVARDGDTVVFVEVRARNHPGYGSAAESIGPRKRRRLVNAAKLYALYRRLDCPMRFDVIGVEPGRIEHIADAFGV